MLTHGYLPLIHGQLVAQECLRQLLLHGAELNHRDKRGWSVPQLKQFPVRWRSAQGDRRKQLRPAELGDVVRCDPPATKCVSTSLQFGVSLSNFM